MYKYKLHSSISYQFRIITGSVQVFTECSVYRGWCCTMEKLFLSSRILLDVNNESVFISGGVLVGSDGKIKNIFYDLKDVQSFKKRNDVTVSAIT